MIEQSARVLAVDSDAVQLRTEQQGGCNSCEVRGGCGTSFIAQWFPGRPEQRLVLPRQQCPASVQAGDTLVLGIPERHFSALTLWLYLVPLLGLIGGAMVGQSAGPGELLSVAGGLGGLVIGLLVARIYTSTHQRKWLQAIEILGHQAQALRVEINHGRS